MPVLREVPLSKTILKNTINNNKTTATDHGISFTTKPCATAPGSNFGTTNPHVHLIAITTNAPKNPHIRGTKKNMYLVERLKPSTVVSV